MSSGASKHQQGAAMATVTHAHTLTTSEEPTDYKRHTHRELPRPLRMLDAHTPPSDTIFGTVHTSKGLNAHCNPRPHIDHIKGTHRPQETHPQRATHLSYLLPSLLHQHRLVNIGKMLQDTMLQQPRPLTTSEIPTDHM